MLADLLTKYSSSGWLRDCVVLASCLCGPAWRGSRCTIISAHGLNHAPRPLAWGCLSNPPRGGPHDWLHSSCLFYGPPCGAALTKRSPTLFHQKFLGSRESPSKFDLFVLRSHALHRSAGARDHAQNFAQDTIKQRTKSLQRSSCADY